MGGGGGGGKEGMNSWHNFQEWHNHVERHMTNICRITQFQKYSYFEKGCRKKVHATIQKSFEGGFEVHCSSKKFEKMAREAMDVCLQVLKGKQQKGVRQLKCQEQCIDHIPFYLSGLSRAQFSDNLPRNSCIQIAK